VHEFTFVLYSGHSGWAEIWRDGTKVHEMLSVEDYDYDRPDIVWCASSFSLTPLILLCSINLGGFGSYDLEAA
jgi:hypothetical protein